MVATKEGPSNGWFAHNSVCMARGEGGSGGEGGRGLETAAGYQRRGESSFLWNAACLERLKRRGGHPRGSECELLFSTGSTKIGHQKHTPPI